MKTDFWKNWGWLTCFIALYGLLPSVLCAQDGTLKWRFETGREVHSSPAIGHDGTIYVGSGDYHLYAINPDGTLKWAFETGGEVHSSPSIGPDGIIYVGSYDDNLYAVNPDGTCNWSFETGGEVYSSPSIGPDGTIYVGSGDNKVHALAPDGNRLWAWPTMSWVDASAAIGPNRSVLEGGVNGYLAYFFNALYFIDKGHAKWFRSDLDTGHAALALSSPSVGADHTVYVGSCAFGGSDVWGSLFAINPDGSQAWAFETGDEGCVASSPSIGLDGTIYVGSGDSNLYALNPEGTVKWTFKTGQPVRSSPAIGNDGTVYVGSYDHHLYAVNPDGTEKWAFETGDWVDSSPVIGGDGTIYVGSWDRHLYAINGTAGGLATSPWPMFQHDARHSGYFYGGKRYPVPEVKINGQDGPVLASTNQSINVTISLDPGDLSGQVCDWWIGSLTPSGLLCFHPKLGWTPYSVNAAKAPLFKLPEVSLLNTPLPTGIYYFFFLLDPLPNNLFDDASWHDTVAVGIIP